MIGYRIASYRDERSNENSTFSNVTSEKDKTLIEHLSTIYLTHLSTIACARVIMH